MADPTLPVSHPLTEITGSEDEPELRQLKFLSDTLVQVLILPPAGASNPRPLPDEPARHGRVTRLLVRCRPWDGGWNLRRQVCPSPALTMSASS